MLWFKVRISIGRSAVKVRIRLKASGMHCAMVICPKDRKTSLCVHACVCMCVYKNFGPSFKASTSSLQNLGYD